MFVFAPGPKFMRRLDGPRDEFLVFYLALLFLPVLGRFASSLTLLRGAASSLLVSFFHGGLPEDASFRLLHVDSFFAFMLFGVLDSPAFAHAWSSPTLRFPNQTDQGPRPNLPTPSPTRRPSRTLLGPENDGTRPVDSGLSGRGFFPPLLVAQ